MIIQSDAMDIIFGNKLTLIEVPRQRPPADIQMCFWISKSQDQIIFCGRINIRRVVSDTTSDPIQD